MRVELHEWVSVLAAETPESSAVSTKQAVLTRCLFSVPWISGSVNSLRERAFYLLSPDFTAITSSLSCLLHEHWSFYSTLLGSLHPRS